MTARKVWVCGRPRYHGFQVEEIKPEIIRIAGGALASDGRRRREWFCKPCREGFFTRSEAMMHWARAHTVTLPRNGDGQCGDWVEQTEVHKGLCGFVAVPPITMRGVLAVCGECGSQWPTRGRARQHWVLKHVVKRTSALRPIDHGTEAGYFQHRSRGEAACEACKGAHADAGRRRSQQWWRGYGGGWLKKLGAR